MRFALGAVFAGLLLGQLVRSESRSLLAGRPLEGRISNREVARFDVYLPQGTFLFANVEQFEEDLAVALRFSDGRVAAEYDSFENAPESIPYVASEAGHYTVELRKVTPSSVAARYRIVVLQLRSTTTGDGDVLRAAELSTQAKRAATSAPEQAMASNREALRFWDSSNFNQARAGTFLKIGDLLFASQDYVGAQDMYQEAGRLAPDHPGIQAEAANNAGMSAARTGDVTGSIELLQRALSIWTAMGHRRGVASAGSNLAILAVQTGEPRKAIHQYLDAAKTFHLLEDPRSEATVLNNLSLAYTALGDPGQAIDVLHKTLDLLKPLNAPVTTGRALTNLGYAHQLRGNSDLAIREHEQAVAILEKTTDRRALADARNYLGAALAESKQWSRALPLFRTALEVYQQTGDRRGVASAMHHLGLMQAAMGEPDDALKSLESSLENRLSAGMQDAAANTLWRIAQVQIGRGNDEQARTRLEQAINIVESLRSKVSGDQFRFSYFAARQDYYSSYLDVLMRLARRERSYQLEATAFNTAERARARGLLDIITESRDEIRRGVPQALLTHERDIQRLLNFRAERLIRVLNSNPIELEDARARQELATTANDYREIEARIRESSPAYASLTQPTPATLAEIQATLDEQAVLLEFARGEQDAYLWVVWRDGFRSFTFSNEIAELARTVGLDIRERDRRAADPTAVRAFRAELDRLADKLLRPALEDLGSKQLIIVGEGPFHILPFAALPDPYSPTKEPLGLTHEIVRLPSASLIRVIRQQEENRRPAPKSLAILTDPVFDRMDPRVRRIDGQRNNHPCEQPAHALARLLPSRSEGLYLRSLAPGPGTLLASGFEANRNLLLNPRLGEYRLIQISSHAVLNDSHPELSEIVLSQVSPEGNCVSGSVRLHEIYNLNLNADLVVLSACETALGAEVRGEGLISMARGFLYAGASRVVSSYWPVDAEATSVLMKAFYRAMLGPRQLRPAAALRAAQGEIHAERRFEDPYYWSGFTIQGEWR